ncbi:hypothetical protein [Methanococcoides sp. NM1]|uniref:hypothetical protein n=1 Tax=Methanococcoides sp. NM1 TaxID=1201013 RepID=UPI0010825623|nr:hypothetical protein [Methanococcoides sp. NM1]
MIVCVFDANVPWDLYKLDKLDQIMKLFSSANLSIHMSNDNFLEMPRTIGNMFKTYQNVEIDESDDNGLNTFKKQIRDEGIILDKKDSAVLYSCDKIDADFVVSSDTNVILSTNKYANTYSKKVKGFHILDIITYLKNENFLDKNECMRIFLALYSKKEIPYLVETHGNELIRDVSTRSIWIAGNTKSCIAKFNTYSKHISNV